MYRQKHTLGYKGIRSFLILVTLCFLGSCFSSLPALGSDDPKELATLANKEIRQAEKLLFAGKAEEARDMLLQGLETLEKLRGIAPEDSKIKGLEQKAQQVRKKLEKKLGTPLTASEVPSNPDPTPVPTVQQDLPPAEKDSVKNLEKKISQELRKSENLFMEGKKEEALALLMETWEEIGHLRREAPGSSQLGNFEKKAHKLAADIGKRTSQKIDLQTGSITSLEAASSQNPSQSSSEEAWGPKKLSYHLREKLKEASKLERGAESSLKWVDTYKERGESSALWLPKIEEARKQLRSLEELLGECDQDALEEGASDHPEILQIRQNWQTLVSRCDELAAEQKGNLAQEEKVSQEAAERGEAFMALYTALEKQYGDLFAGHALSYPNQGFSPYEKALERLVDFQSRGLPKIQEALDILNPFYGTTAPEIEESMRQADYHGGHTPWRFYALLEEVPGKVRETRIATGKDLAAKAEEQLGYLPDIHDFAREASHETIREYTRLAAAFAPEDPHIQAFAEELETRLQEDAAMLYAEVDKRKWPGSISGKDKEEKAGMAFFENDPGWGKREDRNRIPRKVAIRGEWNVQEKDLLGQPVMYGIPAFVAVEVPEEGKRNLLRVYNVTLRTQKQAGAKPEPPFAEITVGDSWYIRTEAIQ
ncbi:MAG TPA: hypothetical protein PK364_08120 [Synergistaceae bacterium]|nr:hypothetical protein [Synergistaceae bacterium]HPJ24526.1 hypothetical protein [Synergistaceae bacterium]HPQ36283.1 hypothetical protein [Synergistaceae bacterium]